jgi:phosphatidylinositol 4-kinase type 2
MGRHSDPGGFASGDLSSVSVFVQIMSDLSYASRKVKLVLKPWACVKDMKDQLQAKIGIPTSAQQLYYNGIELANVRNLVQCGIYQDKVTVDLIISANGRMKQRQNQKTQNFAVIHPYGHPMFPKAIMKAAHLAMQGLALNLTPELAMDGTGGTYFLKDPTTKRNVCCFKPQDEEPFGPLNPRGFIGALGQAGFRKGILSGEACEREVAAYLLDKVCHMIIF